MNRERLTISLADEAARRLIHRARHAVYAEELGQHPVNLAGELHDALDARNVYLSARAADGTLAGFVSLTPPPEAGGGCYSIDKYFAADALPFPRNGALFEARLLTVLSPHRGRETAAALMYAALRWVESHGGERIAAIGRREVMGLYRKAGFQPAGASVRAGAVTYELMHGEVADMRQRLQAAPALVARLRRKLDWRLPFAFQRPAACFHGGRFFGAVGERFDALERSETIINADVLDAWFTPAPGVLETLRDHLPWLVRTSPPADGAGLAAALAEARGVRRSNLLLGAGSSDLMFRALPHWLGAGSRVLLLDPTYGEYAHLFERVLGCAVDRLPLARETGYAVDPGQLEAALGRGYDLAVLVNPNSPTGRQMPREMLETLLKRALPARTQVWIDETYVEYAGAGQSLERFAAGTENVVVCKSMSKVYALSGVRAAYLCAGPAQLESLRALTPPWVVSLPAQVAAVRALESVDYYAARWRETHGLRENLAAELRGLGWETVPGATANFLLCHLPEDGPAAAALVRGCEARGLFLRDACAMGAGLGNRAVRVAVKDAATNARMLAILRSADQPLFPVRA